MADRAATAVDSGFASLWTRCISGTGAEFAWAALDNGYGEAGRAYHNWDHILAMLAGLDNVRREAEFDGVRFDEVELAIYCHDAVYQASQSDNEEQSAELFRKLAGEKPLIGPGAVDRICDMIAATKHHAPSNDVSTRLMLDLDLAVLGREENEYRHYVAAVRREYAFVTEEAWRTGRSAVLRHFLERARIFQTESFHSRLETRARKNLELEISDLGGGA